MSTYLVDRGGQDDGEFIVSIERFYGERYVNLDNDSGDCVTHLTADQARAVAADLIASADVLDSDEAAR